MPLSYILFGFGDRNTIQIPLVGPVEIDGGLFYRRQDYQLVRVQYLSYLCGRKILINYGRNPFQFPVFIFPGFDTWIEKDGLNPCFHHNGSRSLSLGA